jgi:hypothetical protein
MASARHVAYNMMKGWTWHTSPSEIAAPHNSPAALNLLLPASVADLPAGLSCTCSLTSVLHEWSVHNIALRLSHDAYSLLLKAHEGSGCESCQWARQQCSYFLIA